MHRRSHCITNFDYVRISDVFRHNPSHMEGMNQSSHNYNVHNRHCRPTSGSSAHVQAYAFVSSVADCWAEAPIKIARMTLTIKLDGNWSSFQLANSAPPLSVTGSATAPSARMRSCDGPEGAIQVQNAASNCSQDAASSSMDECRRRARQLLGPQRHHSVHFITHQSFAFY